MLKFILRLFVVAVISLTAAFQVVDKGLVTLFSPRLDDLAERSIRGQVHALHKELDPVAPQAREAFGDFDIERLDEYEDVLDEGSAHRGQSALVGMVARKPG